MNLKIRCYLRSLPFFLVCFFSVTVSGAIATAPSNFWKNLQSGKSQTLLIAGTSNSAWWEGKANVSYVSWPKILRDSLNARFGAGLAKIENVSISGANSSRTKSSVNSSVTSSTNAVIIETGNDPLRDGVTLAVHEQNMRDMIGIIHAKNASCEIFFYTMHPFHAQEIPPGGVDTQNKYNDIDRQVASDSGIYLVDTWIPMKEIYDNSTQDGRSRLPYGCFFCAQDRAYNYDGHHSSEKAAKEIIIPCIFSAMKGVDDPAPPGAAPGSFAAQALSDRAVKLTWTALASGDIPVSGISGYNIYRDNALITTARQLMYTDSSVSGETAYKYSIAAVNGSGIEGPKASTSITTPSDKSPPVVVSVTAPSSTQIIVQFNEKLESASAQQSANYSLSPAVAITAAALQSDGKSVQLTTEALTAGSSYQIAIDKVKDIAGNELTKVTKDLLFGNPLAAGYMKNLLQLEDSQNSPCLPASVDQEVMNAYTGDGFRTPFDFQVVSSGGKDYTWHIRESSEGFWANDGAKDSFNAYWAIDIINRQERSVVLILRHDDDVTVWMNGKQIHSITGWDNNKEATTPAFTLPKGTSTFLFRIKEQTGGNHFAAKFALAVGSDITDLLYLLQPQQEQKLAMSFTSPTAGQTFKIGDKINVSWTMDKPDLVSLMFDISADDGLTWTPMADQSVPSTDGQYSWTIPATFAPGKNVVIRARDYAPPNAEAYSASFAIVDSSSAAILKQPGVRKGRVVVQRLRNRICISNNTAQAAWVTISRANGRCRRYTVQPHTFRYPDARTAKGVYFVRIRYGSVEKKASAVVF